MTVFFNGYFIVEVCKVVLLTSPVLFLGYRSLIRVPTVDAQILLVADLFLPCIYRTAYPVAQDTDPML